MLKIIIPLAILLLTASFGQEKTDSQAFDPNKMFSVKELQEDYNSLRKDIEKRQPNLYLYTSKARMDFVFDSGNHRNGHGDVRIFD
ncbi:hypothetical protein BH09BAC5_BH09BAC5_12550 [soil metagenome]